MNIDLCPTGQGVWNLSVSASSKPLDRAGCGVGIDEQRPAFSFKRESMRKVNSNRCFADAAFLVSYCDNLRHIAQRIKAAHAVGSITGDTRSQAHYICNAIYIDSEQCYSIAISVDSNTVALL